jgi:hypothetical protein
MKGKKFYIALIGVFIIGIGSIFIYRQQQETRALEFEGYEIASIESRVDALYNEDKTDIQENIMTELADLEQVFSELNEKSLSHRSEKRIEDMEIKFLSAQEMYGLQEDILELFREENIVRQDTSTDNIEELKTSLVSFEDKTVYYNRNYNLLTDAGVQIVTIEKATKLVDQLTIDDIPNEEINEAELEELEELVGQIKDETIKENLLKQIGTFRLALSEIEEELSLDEDLEEETEEIQEDETLEEESVETVQEANQRTEQTNTSIAQNNNRTNNAQSQTSNNNRTNSSQSNKQSSSSSNNQSSNQNNSQSNTTEQRPTIAQQYQETKVIEEIPYQTLVYENSNIAKGEDIVYSQGSQGAVTETYEVTIYSDGTSNKKVISKNRTEPENRVVTIGTKEE